MLRSNKTKYMIKLVLLIYSLTFIMEFLLQRDYTHYIKVIEQLYDVTPPYVLVTFSNYAQLHLVKHFLCNLAKLNINESFLVIVSDNKSLESLKMFPVNLRYSVLHDYSKIKINLQIWYSSNTLSRVQHHWGFQIWFHWIQRFHWIQDKSGARAAEIQHFSFLGGPRSLLD